MKHTFTKGEPILVCENNKDWKWRIYVDMSGDKYVAVSSKWELEFILDKEYQTTLWTYAKPYINPYAPQSEYAEGEWVEVSDNEKEWTPRMFLIRIKNFVICVGGGNECEYEKGEYYSPTPWRYIRKIKLEPEIKSEGKITITIGGKDMSVEEAKALINKL